MAGDNPASRRQAQLQFICNLFEIYIKDTRSTHTHTRKRTHTASQSHTGCPPPPPPAHNCSHKMPTAQRLRHCLAASCASPAAHRQTNKLCAHLNTHSNANHVDKKNSLERKRSPGASSLPSPPLPYASGLELP